MVQDRAHRTWMFFAATCGTAVWFAAAGDALAIEGPRIVVDLATDSAALDEETAALLGAVDPDATYEVATLEGVLDTGFGAWGPTPPSRFVDCTAEPQALATIEAELAEIESLLEVLEYGVVQNRLTQLESSLCACSEPLPRRLLSRIPYLHGVVSFYADNREGARESFRRASERDPDLEWDTMFPPDPQQVFLMGAADALKSPQIRLVLSPSERPEGLVVNGGALGAGTDSIELVGSRHVLQFPLPDGSHRGVWLVAAESEDVELLGLDAIRGDLTGAGTLEAVQPTLDILAQAAMQRGYHELVVVHAGPRRNLAWRHLADRGKWVDITPLRGQTPQGKARKLQGAGAVMTGAGAGAVGVGAILTADQRARAQVVAEEIGDSAGLYDLRYDEYDHNRQNVALGLGIVGAGAAMMTVGAILLIGGSVMARQGGGNVAVLGTPTPDGFAIGVHGRF